MPRIKDATPKYRKHKATGQAVVTIAGKDHYLGPWRTKASKIEYDRLVGQWLAAGRPAVPQGQQDEITVTEVLAAYWRFAKRHYRKDGEPTGELGVVALAMRPLKNIYGHTRAVDFGPLALKAIQRHLIEAGLSRGGINGRISRIKRIFKWAVSEELVPPSIHHALITVAGLRKNRCDAHETPPILPVDDGTVESTLPHLSPIVADMLGFQRLTGSRPGEVCLMRPCDIDTSGDVWEYRPESHKTEHHDRSRIIFIGPKAQDVLRTYLLREATANCFSPDESERKRRTAVHDRRKTPLSCGNRPGSFKNRKTKRTIGEQYTNNSYRRAVHRACDLAFPPPEPLARRDGETHRQWRERLTEKQREQVKAWQSQHRWSPNQIRHTAATEIRRQYGLEAAQVTLGHATADVSQIYAERDLGLAKRIMQEVG